MYVCGANSMGKEVKSIIKQILMDKLGPADGAKFMEEMETHKRYIMELWGR
jgi:sulfite reductase alpha subunit-like flavoprotein